jgi:serine phosphatase RsbU (regulator of sigma subunit)
LRVHVTEGAVFTDSRESLVVCSRTCLALCEPQIQRSLLPEATPELYGWQLAAHYKLPREVGSDFYDFLELEV